MSESSFTPGPWRVKYGPRHDSEQCDITIAGDIFLLADINGPNYSHCEANARLIAAAPEMLEALKATLFDFKAWAQIRGGNGTYQSAMDRINAAIAKATGGRP